MTSELERGLVVVEARKWLRTPFHHGQCVHGVGVDCARLLVAVYGAAGVIPMSTMLTIPVYSSKWYLHEKESRLLEIIQRYCIPTDRPGMGDIATFTFGRTVAHAGIMVHPFPYMIHADATTGYVTEGRCGPLDALGYRLAGYWTFEKWGTNE